MNLLSLYKLDVVFHDFPQQALASNNVNIHHSIELCFYIQECGFSNNSVAILMLNCEYLHITSAIFEQHPSSNVSIKNYTKHLSVLCETHEPEVPIAKWYRDYTPKLVPVLAGHPGTERVH